MSARNCSVPEFKEGMLQSQHLAYQSIHLIWKMSELTTILKNAEERRME
jgi:hypothetical protein